MFSVAGKSARVPALDGLRALAALAVIAHHTSGWRASAPLSTLAMDCFFALSGFLVGGLALDAMGEPGWQPRFWMRRALRIWPLYFVVCTILTVTDSSVPLHIPSPRWALWTFNENFAMMWHYHLHDDSIRVSAGILWSLAVEEHWYLALPVLLTAVRRRRDVPVLFGVVALGAMALRYLLDLRFGALQIYPFTLTRFDALSFGVMGAWVVRDRPDLIPMVGNLSLLCWGIVLGGFGMHRIWNWHAVFLAQNAGSLGTASLCVLLRTGRARAVARLLSWEPLVRVGEISFGVYVLAPLVADALVQPAEQSGWRFSAVVACTLPVAWLSYRYFERPIQQKAAQLFKLRARQPEAEPRRAVPQVT